MFEFFRRRFQKIEPVFEVLDVDMHNHLIPLVDDGSRSVKMSMECIHTLHDVGFHRMYITPHFQFPKYPNKEDDIRERYAEIERALEKDGTDMQLLGVGGEYRVDDGFKERVKNCSYLTIGKEDYMLVELSLRHPRMGFEEDIFSVQMQDREVILAHPERYLYIDTNSPKLEQLKDQGVLFQCNILSLCGFYGPVVRHRALYMMEKGWIDFLGTDMHNDFYAKALRDATKDRTVRKVLEKYEFLNRRMEE